jgi:hypothetical protein
MDKRPGGIAQKREATGPIDSRDRQIDNSLIAVPEGMIVFPSSSAYCALVSKDHNTNLIAIVDDDESVQSAVQDLIEADGLPRGALGRWKNSSSPACRAKRHV